MKNNKLILKHCPNFYKIINFEFPVGDKITAKLIEIYRSFIFSIDANNPLEIQKIEEIDKVLNKYIDDYFFRKEIRRDLLNIRVNKHDNILMQIVEQILESSENYELGYTRNIYFARWI